MPSRSSSSPKLAWIAFIDMLPLSLAVLPWGVLTGALAIQAGFSLAQSQALSLLVFAGAAQLSAITFFAAGTAYGAIFASTFVISARHLLYSLTFLQHIAQEPWLTRVAVAFLLTDEMFAVSEAHTKRSGAFSVRYALISGLFFYIAWNLATAVGIACLLYTSPSPRDKRQSRMPSSA